MVVNSTNAFHARTGEVDFALDTVGAPTFLSALRALRVGGRAVVVGNVVAEKVPLNLGFLITRGLTIIGGSGATRAEMSAVLAMHDAGPLHNRRRPRLPAPPRRRSAACAPSGGGGWALRPRPGLELILVQKSTQPERVHRKIGNRKEQANWTKQAQISPSDLPLFL